MVSVGALCSETSITRSEAYNIFEMDPTYESTLRVVSSKVSLKMGLSLEIRYNLTTRKLVGFPSADVLYVEKGLVDLFSW